MAVTYSQNGVIVRQTEGPQEDTVVIGGKTYPTIKLGNKIWLAQNLDLDFDGNQIYYNNDESTYGWNGLKYGALYSYSSKQYLVNNIDTIIPGWRIPTPLDWQSLISYAGENGTDINSATHLKSSNLSDWTNNDGDNLYKFNAVGAGIRLGNVFEDLYNITIMWATTQMFYIGYRENNAQVVSWSTDKHNSIRLVRDAA